MHGMLYTTGYEAATIDGFIGRLKEYQINLLMDVRELPLSRKKGFSKNALRERLQKEHIQYVHLRELGSPKPVRDKLKKDWDYASFFQSMDEHLSRHPSALEEAYRYTTGHRCCLMCFEREAQRCHRQRVARLLQEKSSGALEVNNI